jgi:hypothetical protein
MAPDAAGEGIDFPEKSLKTNCRWKTPRLPQHASGAVVDFPPHAAFPCTAAVVSSSGD